MIVALPDALPVTVTVVPDTDTVATPVLLDDALTVPLPDRVTVSVPVNTPGTSDILVALKLALHNAFPMLHFAVLAAVLPHRSSNSPPTA